jgi:hypothetical protein
MIWIFFSLSLVLLAILTVGAVTVLRLRQVGKQGLVVVPAIVNILLLLWAFYRILPSDASVEPSTILHLAMALLAWGWIFRSTWKASQAGRLLLDVGHLPSHRLWILVGSVGIMMMAAVAIYRLIMAEPELLEIARLSFYLAFSGYFAHIGLSRLQVREKGIATHGLIRWQDIEAYRWSAAEENELALRVHTRVPLSRVHYLPVPVEHQGTLEALMEQYAPHASTDLYADE